MTAFACDSCGGDHPAVFSCAACSAWRCHAHSRPETAKSPADLPEKPRRTCYPPCEEARAR